MSEPVICVEGLHHAYKKALAVRGVAFTVARGSIHGFIGPNGAGKTTTLKILATLLPHKIGTVTLFGLDVRRDYKKVRSRVGFMPDHFSMYRQMTAQEYLDFFAAAYGLTFAQRTRTVQDVLTLTDMESHRHDFVKALSRGMQQRLSLARVLVHDPELLLLDEPASGLDPRARIELMEILRELRKLGKTIFISSHILSELALLCDSVTIIDRGRVKYSGSMAGLGQRDGATVDYRLTLAAPQPALVDALKQLPGVVAVAQQDDTPRYRIQFHREQADTNAILRAALDSGGQVLEFQEDVRHLNEAFMDLTEPGVAPPILATTTAVPAAPAAEAWDDSLPPRV